MLYDGGYVYCVAVSGDNDVCVC